MLTNKEVEIINKNLEKGFDVEIQHRKNGIAILKEEKDVCYRSDKKSNKAKIPNGD